MLIQGGRRKKKEEKLIIKKKIEETWIFFFCGFFQTGVSIRRAQQSRSSPHLQIPTTSNKSRLGDFSPSPLSFKAYIYIHAAFFSSLRSAYLRCQMLSKACVMTIHRLPAGLPCFRAVSDPEPSGSGLTVCLPSDRDTSRHRAQRPAFN